MATAALLSCLGFPGWGPLHLRLRRDGEPPALARRLRAAVAASAGRADGQLLAALLRTSPDLEPLLQPWSAAGGGLFHYRLVCVRGPALRLSAWQSRRSGLLLASGRAIDLPIEAFLLDLPLQTPAAGDDPRPAMGQAETRVKTICGTDL